VSLVDDLRRRKNACNSLRRDASPSDPAPRVRAARLEGKASAYGHAAELVKAADLIPRAEVVAWLETVARGAYRDGAAVFVWDAVEDLKAGNPWETP